MKKLMMIALLVFGLNSFAQDNGKKANNQNDSEKMSVEQRNQLKLKKLTLDLSLTDSQQKEMSKIITEQSAKREAAIAQRKADKEKGVKPTADERFAKENQMLDERIALKARVKKILNADQFEKWEKSNENKEARFKQHAEKRDRKHPRPEND